MAGRTAFGDGGRRRRRVRPTVSHHTHRTIGVPASADLPRPVRRVRARILRRDVNPQTNLLSLARRQLHLVVRAVDLFHQRRSRTEGRVRRVVALLPPAVVRRIARRILDLPVQKKRVVTVREHRPVVAGEHHAALAVLGVVALDTVLVEDRLNVAREVGNRGNVSNRRDPAGRTAQGLQLGLTGADGGRRAVFVTTEA